MRFGTSSVWASLGASGLVLASLLAACANGESQGLGVDDPPTTNEEQDSGGGSVLPDDDSDDDTDDSDGGPAAIPDSGSKSDAGKDSGTVDPDDDAGGSDAGSDAGGATNGVALGHACSTAKPCASGLTCVDGACRPSCSNPDSACTTAGVDLCFTSTDPKGDYCTIACDPLDPSAQCGTNSCAWFSGDNVADCVSAGPGGEFDDCSSLLDCQPGYQCFLYMDIYPECEKWCVLGKAGECGANTCTDAFGANAPKSGGQKLGLCQ